MRKLLATISEAAAFWPSFPAIRGTEFVFDKKSAKPFFKYCCAIPLAAPDHNLVPFGALLALASFSL